ncbi:MAG: class I SAM-dependent methyltransferase [Actinomycetota bacterium]|nr:class I SAM-dependent methyltransferase [Actinomycetota bacterium]
MPIMPPGERVFCRTAVWGGFARRVVLPWAVRGQSLTGEALELGGGGGAMAAGLLDRFPGVSLTVADLDPVMVAATAARLRRFGDRARVTVGDATALPFEEASFDVVLSFLMLHHVGAWEAAVGEAVRVLRPGGRFLGYDLLHTAFSRGIHHVDGIHDLRSISANALSAVLADAGAAAPALRPSRSGLTLRWVATKPAAKPTAIKPGD